MTQISQAIIETVLSRLALIFLAAAGDLANAREAARQMLAGFQAETPNELILAAEIVSLQFHALAALNSAADGTLSDNKVIRLRGSAVSLSREQHKAHRKLEQLQRARRAAAQPKQVKAPQSAPKSEAPISAIGSDAPAPQPAANPQPKLPTPGLFQKQEAARPITGNLDKHQAEHANRILAASSGAQGAGLHSQT